MSKNSLKLIVIVLTFVLLVSFFRCVKKRSEDTYQGRLKNAVTSLFWVQKDTLLQLQPLKGLGPNKEKPSTINDLFSILTEDDYKRVSRKNYSAVICMQDIQNDWSLLQIQGIRSVLNICDISILGVTDGEFNPEKQIADYTNVITYLKPDLLITIPLDIVRSAPVLRKAVEKGIKIVFIDGVAEGFKYPNDYAGLVSADSYTNGEITARALVNELNQKGNIAILHWTSKLYTVDQRILAATAVFKEYENIKVIHTETFKGVYDVKRIVSSLIKEHPEVQGLWVTWDVPALEAVQEIRATNKKIKLVTIDLGRQAASEIDTGNILFCVGAQHPYDQGQAEALMGIAALVGKRAPPFVSIPGQIVKKSNLKAAVKLVFHEHESFSID